MTPLLHGLVIREQSGFYWVETQNDSIYMCRLRGRLKEEAQSSDIVAIGDRVAFTTVQEDGVEGQNGIIETVDERRNTLSRALRTTGKRGVGQAEREHILIANVDQAFFVFAVTQPTPNFRLLDRLLTAGELAQIQDLVIVVNKIDLEDPTHVSKTFAPYVAMGYDLVYTSAVNSFGIDQLRERLTGKVSVFTGPSGVGKTSLLNRIQPDLGRTVKAVSQASGMGTHTTRDSAMVKLAQGGYVADTPGIRQMAPWDLEPDELDGYFRDIALYVDQCRFSNCTHVEEPGCAVRQAVQSGHIARTRYENFLHLRAELIETYIVY